ncbi:hypothetical protein ABXT08_17815 [Chryseobacterium sp. NRRL B-14859]|uniref:hypothetical protein n=1 Tax=Chryseobacterium sp. NRRL B-14859 TaxID=1562763 RepID=UPI003396D832
MKYLLLILIFLFFSCHPQSEYVLIKDNLYRDNKNNLYIKTIDNISESNPKPKYISELYLLEKEDPTPISQIVDRNTYHQIEKTNYSKDKKYVYFLRETLEGGFFYVLESIPNNFSILKKTGLYMGPVERSIIIMEN